MCSDSRTQWSMSRDSSPSSSNRARRPEASVASGSASRTTAAELQDLALQLVDGLGVVAPLVGEHLVPARPRRSRSSSWATSPY